MSKTDFDPFIRDDGKYQSQLLGPNPEVVIDFFDLYNFNDKLAMLLLDIPDSALSELKTECDGKTVRIRNLVQPTKIREIEAKHIGKLIQVEAIVVTASVPDATISTAVYRCPCGTEIHEPQLGFELEPPLQCPCGNKRGFKLLREKCERIDTQILQLQERPEELPPGEIPEPLTTVLKEKLIRYASPGDRVRVVGIVRAKPLKQNRSTLSDVKILEANSIEVMNRNHVDTMLSEERIQQIVSLSQQPNLEEILINSYCPSIYGWRHVKKTLIRCTFGGVSKHKRGSFVRGWINAMLTGDPGLAKTALLLFGKDVCQRGVYDTGRGVTGVGLTAALVKIEERFVLAAGTLALGDMGNVFLDEFEKMNREDREMIHVPMENGIITVSKGGLKAALNSRCSVVAAMNPVDGRYNTSKTLKENLRKKPEDFPDSLISRFDIIFVMVDKVERETDKLVAERMLNLDTVNTKEYIPIELFRDYIAYSKRFNPTIPDNIKKKIQRYYEEKRQEMRNDPSKTFTPRQLESIERLIEARARMFMRSEATDEDYEDAVKLHEIYVNETWLDPYTGKVDTGPMVGIPEVSRFKQAEYVPMVIKQMYRDGKGIPDATGELSVRRGDLVKEIVGYGKVDQGRANEIVKIALEQDLVWSPGPDRIKLSDKEANRMLGGEPQTLNTP